MREESEHGKQRQLSPQRVRTPLTRHVALSDLQYDNVLRSTN